MPPKSKGTKDSDELSKEEIVSEVTEEKSEEATKVPAWRAEVVEEGVEESETPDENKVAPKETSEESSEQEGDKKMDEGKAVESLGEVKSEATPTVDLTMPDEQPSGKGKKIFILVFVVVLVGGLLAGGFYYYKTKVSGDSTKTTESPTPKVEATATPTPVSEEVDLTAFKVSIQNGSGIPGEAGKVKSALETEGFEGIDTSNAESYDFTTSEISLKEGTPEAVYEAVKKAMSAYKITKNDEALSEDNDYDVLIIVGSSKTGNTPTPTATPSATKTPTPTP